MSEAAVAIDTGADVVVPDGEVSRADLIKIIEDGRAAESESADGADSDAGAMAGSADAVAQPPSAPSEPAVDPKVSARILAAERAEKRAQAARETHARERAELDKQRAEVAEQAKLVDQLKAAKLSPSKALELLGMSPKEFLESLATEHEPEGIERRASAKVLSETEKLRAELNEMKQAAAQREQAAKQQELQQHSYKAQEQFLEHVAANATQYPHMAEEFTPREIAERGWQIATKYAAAYHAQYGEYPDDSVIAARVETEAKQRAEERAAWRERIGKTAPLPSQGTPAIQGQPATANTPRTLTNGASSQRAAAQKPWTQKDADEESIRLIKSMALGE